MSVALTPQEALFEARYPGRLQKSAPRGRGKSQASLDLIQAAYRILEEIQPASVRAVCYRLFIEQLIADMSKKSTGRVSSQLVWAREQSIIPWKWIVDETSTIDRPTTFASPANLLDAAAAQYRRDRWEQQPVRVLLCSEKSTVAGTVRPVTRRYGVGFLPFGGFSSATKAHDLAELSTEDPRPLVVLYIGDWDPSGMHMSERDIPDRLKRYGGLATVERIALSADDIADPTLPGFSVESKEKDTRTPWFIKTYGRKCWELDAMNPNALRDRVEQRIRSMIDVPAWNLAARAEAVERQSITDFIGAWQKAAS